MAGKLDSNWPRLHPAAAPPDLIGQSSPLGQRYSHTGWKREGRSASQRLSKAVSLWDVDVGGGTKELDVTHSPSIYRKLIPDVSQVVGSSRRLAASPLQGR